jgi:ubiquinol-cytochrome c reductase iron-sulfur subunit
VSAQDSVPGPGLAAGHGHHVSTPDEPTRRDFLFIATGAVGAVGAAALAWPFIDQFRPDAAALALASIEVDVSSLEPGMALTAKWRGKPIFIRNRTPEEVEAAAGVPSRNSRIPSPATPISQARPPPPTRRARPERVGKTGSS